MDLATYAVMVALLANALVALVGAGSAGSLRARQRIYNKTMPKVIGNRVSMQGA